MYSRYFGLKEEPFSIAPNPRYLFMSEQHREALGHLLYGVGVGGGFVLLTGEVGTGKTTVCRSLLEQLPDTTDIAFILNPYQEPLEVLASICDELEVEYKEESSSVRSLSNALYEYLLANHAKGRNTVLLIDEAQNLDTKVLELIRLLTNLETDNKKLLQIIFIGQPELKDMLAQPELRQLAQRITARFHLKPLSLAETQSYIRHRLQVAGLSASQELFSDSAIKEVHKRSGGVPRLINVLCDRMMLGTYTQNKTRVDQATLDRATLEVLGEENAPEKNKPWPQLALIAVVLVAIVIVLLWPDNASTPAPAEAVAVPFDTQSVQTSAQQHSSNAQAPSARGQLSPAHAQLPAAARKPYYFSAESSAMSYLYTHLGMPELSGPAPCDNSAAGDWQCGQTAVKNWRGFIDINRPAVLRLVDGNRVDQYVVVLGLEGTNLQVLSTRGERQAVAMIDLGQWWTGEFTFVWQGPVGFTKPLSRTDRGEAINWIAGRFAQLDQQEKALAEDVFNQALETRVTLFQREYGLDDDGIVGLRTLLKMNEALGVARSLTQPVSPVAEEN